MGTHACVLVDGSQQRRRSGITGIVCKYQGRLFGLSRILPSFAGLQAYHGSAQHLRGWDERRQAIAQAADKAGSTRDLLTQNGIPCPVVTGAGTGSF